MGFEGSLVWAPAPLQSLSLGYSISHRRVYDYGFGNDLRPSSTCRCSASPSAGSVGTLESTRNRSALTLEGSYGRLDRIANPRKGYVIRPRLETTLPGFNTSEYLLLDLGATAYIPLTKRIGFTLRAGAGRIFPYGNSITSADDESPFVSLLRLRDVTFTAGGSRDVRGWGTFLVGPKLPQVTLQRSGDSTLTVSDRYTPVGGLARLVASVELHFPHAAPRRKISAIPVLGRRADLDPGQPLRASGGRARRGQVLPCGRCRHRLRDGRRRDSGGARLQAEPLAARRSLAAGRAERARARDADRCRTDLDVAPVSPAFLHRHELLRAWSS